MLDLWSIFLGSGC